MSASRPDHPTRREFIAAAAAAAAAPALAEGRVVVGADSAAPWQAGPAGVRRFSTPGLVDLQVNGFAGVDFNDPGVTTDQVRHALDVMRRHGVTGLLPTIITSTAEHFGRCARAVLRSDAKAILGIHMEGPYISPEDGPRGAHPREFTGPASLDDFKRRQDEAEGRIVLVTLAPEVPGALPLIEHLRSAGVRAAIGHTGAAPELIRDAIRAGATLSTHLGNGCANLIPRHPNFIWEQLAADELTASLVVDGHHLPPATVKSMIRAKTPERVILVTDAISAAGQPPGEYQIGSSRVRLDENGRVAVPGAPNLAGSALTLDRAVANTVRFAGVTIEQALAMASTRPAAYLGVAAPGTLDVEWDAGSFTLRVLRASS
ncbi:MAG TPA: amidohydrolase family protein [Vicinamibacterales bacterium]|nr:amidohydrolase family protein [Vicinamibacterales bacterium]HOQ59101.1 amidohydrolase family protein [Vicinamibacterales bacterium]HPK70516.1 amidohydrolase family protein [Vicinamibacterales bacterium]